MNEWRIKEHIYDTHFGTKYCERNDNLEKYIFYLFFLSNIFLLLLSSFRDIRGKELFLYTTIFFVLSYFLNKFKIEKYFNNKKLARIITFTVLSMLILTFYSVSSKISKIENSNKKPNERTIVFDKSINIPENIEILGANSRYFFFYDNINKDSYIIPNDKIQSLKIKNSNY